MCVCPRKVERNQKIGGEKKRQVKGGEKRKVLRESRESVENG